MDELRTIRDRKGMKSVSIMWSEGVETKEAEVAVATIYQLLQVIHQNTRRKGIALPPTSLRPFGNWVIPALPEGSPYSATSWYIQSAYRAEVEQVDARMFLDLVRNEPWQRQRPHYDLALIDHDLTDTLDRTLWTGETRYALSSVLPNIASVVSVHRLRAIADEERRMLALRRLVVHTFGHLLGLPAPERTTNVVTDFGERHCTNRCVMRHAASVDDVLKCADEEVQSNSLFCRACHRDLLAIASRSVFSLN